MNTMTIRCGNCGGRHDGVADVKNCYQTSQRPGRRSDEWAGQPPKTNGPVSVAQPATEKQVKFLGSLLHRAGAYVTSGEQLDQLPKKVASLLIDGLLGYLQKNELLPAGVSLREPSAHDKSHQERSQYDVPAGHYATPSATGNNDLDFWRVDRPTAGRWAGRTFVKRVIGGHSDTAVRGATALAALQAILAAGVTEAGNRYADELGRCKACNRSLTDELSRQRRVGPDCWGQGKR